jgi:chaperonin cofactor prefoldin
MSTDIAVKRSIEEAEKRVDAMQVLLEILTGQVKGERQQLEKIKAAIASAHGKEGKELVAPVDISLEMLDG